MMPNYYEKDGVCVIDDSIYIPENIDQLNLEEELEKLKIAQERFDRERAARKAAQTSLSSQYTHNFT